MASDYVAQAPKAMGSEGRMPVPEAIQHWEQMTLQEERDSCNGSPGAEFSFSKDRGFSVEGTGTFGAPDEMRRMIEQAVADHLSALERRLDRLQNEVASERLSRESLDTALSERLEVVSAHLDKVQMEHSGPLALASAAMLLQGTEGSTVPQTPKSRDSGRGFERLVDERLKAQNAAHAAALRDSETRVAAVSNELSAVSEGHRLQVLKVTQAVSELGREISFRMDRIEADMGGQAQRLHDLEIGRHRVEELAELQRTQGLAFGKQEASLALLREDLKNEQRIRKEEIYSKLRELAARPVRPEEQAVAELRQSVVSVRDECSRLRSECRRLSSEVVARDSEVLARVLRQLNDMRSLLDQGALEEVAALPERAREAASRAAGKAAGRGEAAAGRGAGRSGRVSPARERNQASSAASRRNGSASARQLTRGQSPKRQASESKAGGSPGLEAASAEAPAEVPPLPLPSRDGQLALASLGTTPLSVPDAAGGSRSIHESPTDGLASMRADFVQEAPRELPESMGNVMRPTVDARMQAAVAAVTAVQAVNNDAMTASRSGSPAPIVHYQHPVQLPAQACSARHNSPMPMSAGARTSQNSAAAPAATRISPAMQGSCQVLAPNLAPAVYQRPPRPAMCIRGAWNPQ